MRNTEKRDKAFRLMTMASIYGHLAKETLGFRI